MSELADNSRPDSTPPQPEDLHERYFGHEHLTVIQRSRGWRSVDLRELWAYRELFFVLTMRDVSVRYKQTVLGAAWAVIQPIMTMVVFSIIFGKFAKMPSDGFPYPVFVYAGLLPWTFFAGSLQRSSSSVVGSAQLVNKVYFPRLIIPLASVGSGIIDLAISTAVMLAIMAYYGVSWSLNLLAAPLLVALVLFVALGVGTLISALNVAYRDFRYLTPFLVQLWMYATPVIYPPSLVPEKWHWLLFINPMAGVIEGFRFAFLGKPVDPTLLLVSLVIGAILFLIGIAYFERVERRFADLI